MEFSDEEITDLAKKIQKSLLKQAARNPGRISLPSRPKMQPGEPVPVNTIADLIEALKNMPQDLVPYLTNGDLPNIPLATVSIEAADGYGQIVLLSR